MIGCYSHLERPEESSAMIGCYSHLERSEESSAMIGCYSHLERPEVVVLFKVLLTTVLKNPRFKQVLLTLAQIYLNDICFCSSNNCG